MRVVCGIVVALAAGLFAGWAAAVDLPPLPSAPVPVPTLPTLPPAPSVPPLPTPAPPTVPAPPVQAPTVQTPSLPTPTVPTPTVSAPIPSAPSPTRAEAPAPAPAPAQTTPATTPPPTATAAAEPTPTSITQTPSPVQRVRPTAHRRTEHPQPRPVVTTFRVVRAGPLRVRILELAPVCKHLRGFTFGAHRGSNTLRLPKRITTIGTYLLTGHRGEHTVFMFRARLVRGRHVKLGGGANVCMAQPTETANVTYVVPVASGASAAPQALEPPRQQVSAAKAIGDSPRNWSPLFRAVTLRDGPTPLVYLLLALAAVSFTAAALPPSVVGGQVAARRSQLAAAGIWLLALAAVVITFA